VHFARDCRGVRLASRLKDWQGIHVGAQTNCFATVVGFAVNEAHDTRAPDPCRDHIASKVPQFARNQIGCAMRVIK
jgi:hypothetical protein